MQEPNRNEEPLDMTEDILPPPQERSRDLLLASLLLLLHAAISLLPALLPPLRAYASPLHTLSYLLPVFLYLLYAKKTIPSPFLLPPKPRELLSALPLLPVFLLAVIAVAALTSIFLPTGGGTPVTDLGTALLLHALLPALLEEGLMRLAVLSLLYRHFGSTAVYVSAVLFMLLHAPISMPYALVGGILLGAVTLISHSALTAMLFHLINNALSLLLAYLVENALLPSPRTAELLLIGTLSLLSVFSVIYLVRHRRDAVYVPLSALLSPKGHGRGLAAAAGSPLALAALFLLLLAVL